MTQGYIEPTVDLVRKYYFANPGLIIKIPKGTSFYRLQLAQFPTPFHFNPELTHRFADPLKRIGIMYMGLSVETVLLEYMKEWPVRQDDVDRVVVYELKLNRDLYVVDAPALNRCFTNPFCNIVERGDGRRGYAPTQALSGAVIEAQLPQVGGILYLSQAGCTASIEVDNGKCLALFEGSGENLFKIISRYPLGKANLPFNKSVMEFLEMNGIPCW